MRLSFFVFVLGVAWLLSIGCQNNTATAPVVTTTTPKSKATTTLPSQEAPATATTPTAAPVVEPAPPAPNQEKLPEVKAKPKPSVKDLTVKNAAVKTPSQATAKETKPHVEEILPEVAAPPVVEIPTPDHAPFAALLKKHVKRSGVDYAGLKNDLSDLDAYLAAMQNMPPTAQWSRQETMAFWINVYNAATLQLVLRNYPLKSILDLDNGKTWDVKRIKIGDKNYSLNEIENDILRKKYKDARIHFAVNCAARSCPPLLNDAFVPARLNTQLEAQTKAFINDTKHNTLTANTIEVSKIFEWYKEDFGDLVAFINKYTATDAPPNTPITYKEYNWELNKQ